MNNNIQYPSENTTFSELIFRYRDYLSFFLSSKLFILQDQNPIGDLVQKYPGSVI